ncbi:MAG: NADH-quinone oxidoreductase subunit A [Candidatus Dadabacteria bacterium]|nr:MAG: NADH-quinone oxidoreductase subunit A [Candidatus Dadabacteria bacterium]
METAFNPYLAVALFALFSAGFVITMLFLSIFLGPKNPTITKQNPFECGAIPVQDVKHHRFNVKFYLVAMVFILFDIEVIFLYPWAVSLKKIGAVAYFEMLTFLLVLVVGFVYLWRKKVLDWNV